MVTTKRFCALLLLTFFFTLSGPLSGDNGLIIVAHAHHPGDSVRAKDLRDYFMKQKRYWPDGTLVRPVDRLDGSKERATFLKSYLNKSAREMSLYWIGQKLYSGDTQPLQVGSDREVMNFVSRFPGSIGYVSTAAADDANFEKIKMLKVID